MKALVFHKPKDIRFETVPDPVLEHPRDILLKVSSTAICGSDLHIYNGMFPQVKPLILGHEFMGTVEEVGAEITSLKKGDRVIVPFSVSCGKCWFCEHRLAAHCEQSNLENYGPEGGIFSQKGGGLFGYTDLYGGYDGGQAEYVRVPFADVGPRKVPEDLADEQVLFLTDILPTGWWATEMAQMQGGETVAIFGCGPVGLMAQKVAWYRGAKRVIGIDIEPYRLAVAQQKIKSEIIDAQQTNPVEQIREWTAGRGADICIDAVGMEAHRNLWDRLSNLIHLQRGSSKVLQMAMSGVRRGGAVSVVGVYGTTYDNFPLSQLFDKGLTLRSGAALIHNSIDFLLDLVKQRKIILEDIISHILPLSDGAKGYRLFNEKKENCVKVVLKP